MELRLYLIRILGTFKLSEINLILYDYEIKILIRQIFLTSNFGLVCGGSIIASQWILTGI
jgi:hypothetical protein